MLRRKTLRGTIENAYDCSPDEPGLGPPPAKRLVKSTSACPTAAGNVAQSVSTSHQPVAFTHHYATGMGANLGTDASGIADSYPMDQPWIPHPRSPRNPFSYPAQSISLDTVNAFFPRPSLQTDACRTPVQFACQASGFPVAVPAGTYSEGPPGTFRLDGRYFPYRRAQHQARVDGYVSQCSESSTSYALQSAHIYNTLYPRGFHINQVIAHTDDLAQRSNPAQRSIRSFSERVHHLGVIQQADQCESGLTATRRAPLTEQDLRYRTLSGAVSGFAQGAGFLPADPSFDSVASTQPWLFRQYDAFDQAGFRDEVLGWAHRVYIDLLAAIQEAKRIKPRQDSMNEGNSTGVDSAPPAYIHPSQQLYSLALSVQPEPAGQSIAVTESKTYHRPISYPQVDNVSPDCVILAEQQLVTPKFDRGTRYQYAENGYGLNAGPGPTAALISGGLLSAVTNSRSTLTEAQNALDKLESLCLQNAGPWFDGLLLAGCIAYGLNIYDRAALLFQHILSFNPSHVEALSNLAAALLSLGRLQEAEQQWRKAVQLRPGYFEAVEQLLGLYCNQQRIADAIELIDFVDTSLRRSSTLNYLQQDRDDPSIHDGAYDRGSECSYTLSTVSCVGSPFADTQQSGRNHTKNRVLCSPRASGSIYAVPSADNGRLIALVHARGNLLYTSGDQVGAVRSFELAVLIACGDQFQSMEAILRYLLSVYNCSFGLSEMNTNQGPPSPLLLPPERAVETAKVLFPPDGCFPGLSKIPSGSRQTAAIATTSNALLSLAKIYQDRVSSASGLVDNAGSAVPLRDILLVYYLSLSLQPSPSTANNVGILLAGVQQTMPLEVFERIGSSSTTLVPGVQPGSGVALALAYYQYGLTLDQRHAHLFTNLGSLLKDIGHLPLAIKMYELAVQHDGKFDIALANLANAVKDQGRVADAIQYYREAVSVNPNFAEAVCGLANALNSVCLWDGRGGENRADWSHDQWHVGSSGELLHVRTLTHHVRPGWMKQVVDIVSRQLKEGRGWGKGLSSNLDIQQLALAVYQSEGSQSDYRRDTRLLRRIRAWMGRDWEGSRMTRLVQRLTKKISWRWYQDQYVHGKAINTNNYFRPILPAAFGIPAAPTVLPFHTFTYPLGARAIRMISQWNALRLAYTTMKLPWLPATVLPPPSPPSPVLRVGYVSSDFNNHPLAHLMQSVFGLHDRSSVEAHCYATSASDGSIHRKQIERESPHFLDVSRWSSEKLVHRIVTDGIHILINLNGYTRGARNEVFAARAAPIQMAFMGFAGSLGAEWCDYLLADRTAVPPNTLRPYRYNFSVEDVLCDHTEDDKDDRWMYSENVIFSQNSFFCCDHKQSAPDASNAGISWSDAQMKHWAGRKALFPSLADDIILLANFNQLYKLDPTTFRTWLRILARLPNAVLWLLRFPELGETNLRRTARLWAGESVAERIIFTDVSDKSNHLERCGIVDLVLDTGECNAHTTAADVLWSGTPMVTRMRYEFKMCSRMGGSILKGAVPQTVEGRAAEADLIVDSEEMYEENVVRLAGGLRRATDGSGKAVGRLVDLKMLLWKSRWTSSLFDTKQWVHELERAYWIAWGRWVAGEGGDIWL